MSRNRRYPPEVRERAVALVLEHQSEHRSQWAAMEAIASKFGMAAEARFACQAHRLSKEALLAAHPVLRRMAVLVVEAVHEEGDRRQLAQMKAEPAFGVGQGTVAEQPALRLWHRADRLGDHLERNIGAVPVLDAGIPATAFSAALAYLGVARA